MQLITLLIAPDFGQPISPIRFWLAAAISALRAVMPETTMYENAYPLADKNNIRLSGQS